MTGATRAEPAPARPRILRACACGARAAGHCPDCGRRQGGVLREAGPSPTHALERIRLDHVPVSMPGDPVEREADRMADAALAGRALPPPEGATASAISRQASTSAAPAAAHGPLAAPEGAGAPLPAPVREELEAGFAHDFAHVRIHAGPLAAGAARSVDADAYAAGANVVFGEGRYAPATHEGRRLLAHELAHVVQADRGAVREPPILRQPRRRADTVAAVRINLTSHRVVFQLASGATYEGTVDTDLAAGSYVLTPDLPRRRWSIRGTPEGLRFNVSLDGPDPFTLSYPRTLSLEVAQGTPADRPISEVLGTDEVVAAASDPTSDPRYVQNGVQGVGIFGWGGPFRLDRRVVNGVGVDSFVLPRAEFSLWQDPLAGSAIAVNLVYRSAARAQQAASEMGAGAYSFYLGPGGFIYPTVISDTTAPALVAALRRAVEIERQDAQAATQLSVDLLLWYVGARFPMRTSGGGGNPPRPPGQGVPPTPTQGNALPTAAAATGAASRTGAGAGEALTFVEIGAGDLRASIELARRGGVRVIAVDPAVPAAQAMAELRAAGGTFVRGTADDVAAGVADHVFQYFPWRIGGTGSFVTGGTWRLVDDTLRLLKPNGAAHFVTEDLATAEFLAGEAARRGLRAVLTETTAAAAAPGAAGSGVPNFLGSMRAWLVNIYR